MTTKYAKIISNGQQAPYGIGEIMEIFPLAHHRKILAYIGKYYNAPNIQIDGDRAEAVFDQSDNFIRFKKLPPY